MKRITFAKLLSILLAASLGASLASCGQKSKGPVEPTGDDTGDGTGDGIGDGSQQVLDEGRMAQAPALPAVEMSLADVGLDAAAMDKTVNPCDDFYQYACGSWLKNTEIPADKSRWARSFSVIDERNRQELKKILEAAAAAKDAQDTSPIIKKIGAFYATCMDEKAVDKQGTKPIDPLLALARKVKDVKSLAAAVTELHKVRAWVLFDIAAEQDFKDATSVIGFMDQNGLGLGDRDYYLSDDAKFKDLRTAYLQHVERVLVLSGMKAAAAKKGAEDVMLIETELAKVSLSNVEKRDPQKIYNKVDRAGLATTAPTFPWDAYFAGLGRPDLDAIAITSTKFFAGMDALLATVKPAAWQSYLVFHLVDKFSMSLGKKFQDEAFAMAQVLTQQKTLEDRWKRCARATDAALGELLAQPYVDTMFAGESKVAAAQMVVAITQAFGENLATLSWMDAPTRELAAKKLSKMVFKIGYPDTWRTYDFPIDAKQHGKNVLAGTAYELQRNLKKIGQPVDRAEWGMTPPTVNAYYNPTMNEMVFPAGILQPPFYSAKNAVAVNLGSIGWVVGHELTHGFDDQGAQFDGDGNLKNWWAPAVETKFKERTSCVVNQYAQYAPLPDLKLNGELTNGENIADIGGVKMAFRAYRALRKAATERIVAEGFSEDQLFFLAGAQAWCSNSREAATRRLVQGDPHSPPEFRVIGAFSDNVEFAEAFSCPAGSKMNPKDACEVW